MDLFNDELDCPPHLIIPKGDRLLSRSFEFYSLISAFSKEYFPPGLLSLCLNIALFSIHKNFTILQ